MMSVGHNAKYLHHAAVLLESLTAQVTAAVDEEQLWRYKYETVIGHADLLEAECEALKHDIDGHLNIIASTLAERDTLKATLQGREAELSELLGALERERGEQTAASEAHELALAELHAGFERERETLKAATRRAQATNSTCFALHRNANTANSPRNCRRVTRRRPNCVSPLTANATNLTPS